MSIAQFGSLATFDHSIQSWKTYKSRLLQWFVANDVNAISDPAGIKRRAILLTALTERSYQLVEDLALPKTLDDIPYEDILTLFDAHFIPKRLGFAERHNFYAATQQQTESRTEWAARLRELVVNCNFSNVEEALRDRFVMGMRPGLEKETLYTQDLTELTLRKVVELAENITCAASAASSAYSALVNDSPTMFKIREVSEKRNVNAGKIKCSVCRYNNYKDSKCVCVFGDNNDNGSTPVTTTTTTTTVLDELEQSPEPAALSSKQHKDNGKNEKGNDKPTVTETTLTPFTVGPASSSTVDRSQEEDLLSMQSDMVPVTVNCSMARSISTLMTINNPGGQNVVVTTQALSSAQPRLSTVRTHSGVPTVSTSVAGPGQIAGQIQGQVATPVVAASVASVVTAASQPQKQTLITQKPLDNAKEELRNFFANLLDLSSKEPKSVKRNVRNLIQELIDAQVEPEEFCDRLERILNARPQPCLVGFLKKTLPLLRQSLVTKESVIEGINPPSPEVVFTNMPTSATQPVAITNAIPLQKPLPTAGNTITVLQNIPVHTKINVTKAGKTMTVNNKSNFARPAASTSRLSTVLTTANSPLKKKEKKAAKKFISHKKIKSCKDEYLIPTNAMLTWVKTITEKHGLEDPSPAKAAFINQEVQKKIKNFVKKLVINDQYRIDSRIKPDPSYEVSEDAKGQLKVELEALRQREANLEAIQEIEPRKKPRLEGSGGSGNNTSNRGPS